MVTYNYGSSPLGTTVEQGELALDIRYGFAPVGTILPWAKQLGGHTPGIPTGWVECDGSVLSDAGSVYNGDTIPDLNGGNQIARGNSTSGGTGGGTHNHQALKANTGTNAITCSGSSITDATSQSFNSAGTATTFTLDAAAMTGDYYTNKIDGSPPYYDVVWIMRVK